MNENAEHAKNAAAEAVSDAIRRAEESMSELRRTLESSRDQISEKATAAASKLLREGQDLLDSDTLSDARDAATGAVKRNPLTALMVAFGAGLLLALLARG